MRSETALDTKSTANAVDASIETHVSFWLVVSCVIIAFALPGLFEFGRSNFAYAFVARMTLAAAALILGLMQLGIPDGIVFNQQSTRRLLTAIFFFTALVVELACSLKFGVLQPGLAFLVVWALGTPIVQQRKRRMQLEASVAFFVRIKRSVQKQLADLRASISVYQTNLFFTRQSQERKMIAQTNQPGMKILETSTHTLNYSKARKAVEGPILPMQELTAICDAVTAQKREQYQAVKRLSILFNRPTSIRTDVMALADTKDTKRVLEGAIDLAIRSIGGGDGIIRVTLTSSLRLVTIGVEDNGYGMSEERLAIAGGPTAVTYAQMRGLVAFWGGRFLRQARLGVGSRVLIELPRVDAFAYEAVSTQQLMDETAHKKTSTPESNPDL